MDASKEMYVFNLVQDFFEKMCVGSQNSPEVSVKGKISIQHVLAL